MIVLPTMRHSLLNYLTKMLVLLLFIYISVGTAKALSISEIFLQHLKDIVKARENFTNCEEFLNGSTFDVKRVLNDSWQVFYFYDDMSDVFKAPVVFANFHEPNPALMQRFRQKLDKIIVNADWDAAKLVYESNKNFGCILTATSQSGLFNFIPTEQVEHIDVTDYDYPLALRFVEPHYLGLLNCKFRHLMVLAPVGKMPTAEEAESVAKQFKFRSIYGMSYYQLKSRYEKIKAEFEKHRKQHIMQSLEEDRDLNMIYGDPNINDIDIL